MYVFQGEVGRTRPGVSCGWFRAIVGDLSWVCGGGRCANWIGEGMGRGERDSGFFTWCVCAEAVCKLGVIR